jgi:hypothetical protein
MSQNIPSLNEQNVNSAQYQTSRDRPINVVQGELMGENA